MIIRALSAAFLVLAAPSAFAQATSTVWPNQRAADFIIKDFRFKSGETIAELKQHYTTLGTAKRNAAGDITNAVILLHGTSSSGTAWLMPSLAGELFAPASLSTPRNISSSCPTVSAAAARASRATACAPSFPTTAMTTSLRLSTNSSPKGSA